MGSVLEAFLSRGAEKRPSNRALLGDALLGLLLGAVALAISLGLGSAVEGVSSSDSLGDNPLAWPLLVGPALLVPFRRLAPGAALFIGAILQTVVWTMGTPNSFLSMSVLLYSAAYFGSTFARKAAPVLGILLTAYTMLGVIVSEVPLYALPVVGLLSVGAYALGSQASQQRDDAAAANARAEDLVRSRAADRERAMAAERARIARELHDVVAHGLSVIVVQAAAARRILDKDPDGAATALQQIEQTGRNSLGEMRQVLSVIRTEPEESWQPAPGLDALDDLVAELADTGLAVTVNSVEPESGATAPATVPATVDLTAYRIVQESLTNVLKHGGAGVSASVDIRRGPTSLDLEIMDNGRGAEAVDSGGHGLRGMQERVEVFGGQFAAGPKPDGGFLVSVSLPIPADDGDRRA